MSKWIPISAAVAFVCVAGFFVFHDSLSRLLDRVAKIGPEGVTLVQHFENVNITVGNGSFEELERVKTELGEKAASLLGMHPVAFSYLIRSGTCSFWNLNEIRKADQLRHLVQIRTTGFADLYMVRSPEIERKMGGAGLQVIFNNRGRFFLRAFEVDAEACAPHPAAVVLE